jgi:phospholipid/cholesterol/gamma-HCH transport system permease protein
MSASILKLPEILSPGDVARLGVEARSAWKKGEEVRLDGGALTRLDTLGQAFLSSLRSEAEDKGRKLALEGFNPEIREQIEALPKHDPNASEGPRAPGLFESVGQGAYSLVGEWKDIALLFSEAIYHTTWGLRAPKTILRGDTSTQMIRLGSTALPIVLLLSSLIGFTLALQSGLQLAKYGAAIFLADGIGISMITEIGPLMTAVILAGRSGSAITAELATMTVQEEVSALRSMSINPLQFLVLPRFWALSVTQPLLTVASAVSGIFSGLLVALLFFDISPSAFLNQLQSALTLTYVWQMAVKSLTFAWLIVFIASVKGLSVRGGADAVGRATTACVVNCIFAIVLGDALFSFIFYL